MIKEFEKRLLSSFIIIPIAIFFIIQGSVFFTFFLSILFLATSYEWLKMIKKNNLLKILGIIFLFFSFCVAFIIREADSFKPFLFIVIICISTDIGGYIFGKIFKGPKLTKISPNKTYAGVIGAFFFVIIFVFFINKYLLNFASEKISFGINIFILAILISIFSQLGDILISYFKRQAKVKDSGKLIPGHGGLLDRIDGMIFAFPIFYILNLVFKI